MSDDGNRKYSHLLQCLTCSSEIAVSDSVCANCGAKTFLHKTSSPSSGDQERAESGAGFSKVKSFRSRPVYVGPGWSWGAAILNWMWLFAHRQVGWALLILALNLPFLLVGFAIADPSLAPSVYASESSRLWGGLFSLSSAISGGALVTSVLCIPLAIKANKIAWESGKYDTYEQYEIKKTGWDAMAGWIAFLLITIPLLTYLKWGVSDGSWPDMKSGCAVLLGRQSVATELGSINGSGAAQPVMQHYGYGYDPQKRLVIRSIICPDCQGTGRSGSRNFLGHYTDCPVCHGSGQAPVTIPVGASNPALNDAFLMVREEGQP